MTNFNENEMRRVVAGIAKQHKFSDNISIDLFSGSGKSDGFTGQMIMITVEDKNKLQTLHLIAKVSMKDENVRGVMPVEENYSNEIFAYGTIFPTLRKFQQEYKIPRIFNSTAKYFGASNIKNEEYLILENLKKSGFDILPLRQLLDHEHVQFIFEKYGEFHASSFAYKILHPEKFRSFQKELKNIWTAMSKIRLGEMIQEMLDSIRQFMKERGYTNNQLDKFTENCVNIMEKVEKEGEQKCACVLHGDCWSNNLMLKYEIRSGHKQLEDIKFVDWQACSVGPPVFDLSYSLYSGASEEVLDNLESYLKIYHDSLSNSLAHFKLDVKLVYPFEELKRQWKKYYHFGALIGTTVWKVRSMEEEHRIDTANYKADDDSTHLDGLVRADCNWDYLYEHIKILYEHLDKIPNLDW